MDARFTLDLLDVRAGEHVLDAGCGTGRNTSGLLQRGARPVGLDFSKGMLSKARAKYADVRLAQANLEESLPCVSSSFDAAVCALVGEHLDCPGALFAEVHRVLKPHGRFVFSVYHPQMAQDGIEANFDRDGTEYRLGANKHLVSDYVEQIEKAGFTDLVIQEKLGDDELVRKLPKAQKYLGAPVLLLIQARPLP